MKTISQIAKEKGRTDRTVRSWIKAYESSQGGVGSWRGNARVFSDDEISAFSPDVEDATPEPVYEVINADPAYTVTYDNQAPRTAAPALVPVHIENLNITIVQQDTDSLLGQAEQLKGITASAFGALQNVMTERLVGHIRLADAQNQQAVAAAQATAATKAVGAIA